MAAGDEVTVSVELDPEPREVRKEHVRAIEEAKTAETRERRIAKALELLQVR